MKTVEGLIKEEQRVKVCEIAEVTAQTVAWLQRWKWEILQHPPLQLIYELFKWKKI
jgi:hypothetical protein